MIRDDHSIRFRKLGDKISVIKRPGGIAVNHKDGLPLSFVEIMQGKVILQFQKIGFEGI
jgi:hypothetical protein